MLSSAISNKESVNTSAKHGNYSVKVDSEKYSTWYMKFGKYNINLQIPKQTDLHDAARPDSLVTALWAVHIVKNDRYFLPFIILQTLISVIKSTWLAFKISWKRVTQNFFMDNFDLVLSNKLTTLYSLVLWTHQCAKTFMT